MRKLLPLLLLLALTCYAGADAPAAPQGVSVFGDITLANYSTGGAGAAANAVFTTVPVAGQSFKEAIQVKVAAQTANPWDILIESPATTVPLKKGEYILATFAVRCTDAANGTGSFSAYLQAAGPPWFGIATKDVVVGKDWKRIMMHVQADRDFPAGQYDFALHLGTQAQTLEIGGISVLDMGTSAAIPTLLATPATATATGVSVFGEVTLADFPAGGAGAAANALFTTVPVAGQAFTQAIQAKITAKTANPWDIQIGSPISVVPLKKGEYVLATFSVRCTDAPNGGGSLSAYVQAQGPPWFGITSKDVVVGKDWKQVVLHTQTDRDFPAGTYDFSLHLGAQAQTLEIGGISVLDMGTNAGLPTSATATAMGADASVYGNVALTDFSMGGNEAAQHAVFTIAPVTGQTFAQAIHVKIDARTTNAWDVQIETPDSIVPLKKGEYNLASFAVRCTDSPNGLGSFNALVQDEHGPWIGIAETDVVASDEWQRVYIHGKAEQDFSAGQYDLCFHLGKQAQTLEIGDISLVDLGPNVDMAKLPFSKISYPGMEPDAPWRKEAAARIEKFRTSGLTISVMDKDNKPVAGAKVHLEMQRQAYGFRSELDYSMYANDGANNKNVRDWTLKMFNGCTTPIYFADWGWANPGIRPQYMKCAQWAQDNQLTTRGHCIIYPGWTFLPASIKLLEKDPVALRKALLDHVVEVTEATKKFNFAEYDVTNELRALHDITDILGKDAVVEWFKTARQHAPATTKMAINENTILTHAGLTQFEQDTYAGWIQYLIDHGQGPDVIGMQGHFGATVTAPEKVYSILDRFAKFGKPIQITEFDLPSGDEQGQAQYLRDFLTIFYSHPATTAFTVWGFWEGTMWRPQGAFIRKDWTLKPNGQAWLDLVRKEWWTDVTNTTGADGACKTRGYLGDYNITVTVGDKVQTNGITLSQPGDTSTIITLR